MLFSKFFDFFQNRKPLRRTSAPTANDDPEKLSNKLQPNLSIITQTLACYCCVLFNLAHLLHLSSCFLKNFRFFFKPDVFSTGQPVAKRDLIYTTFTICQAQFWKIFQIFCITRPFRPSDRPHLPEWSGRDKPLFPGGRPVWSRGNRAVYRREVSTFRTRAKLRRGR